jgi:hypothetical protein
MFHSRKIGEIDITRHADDPGGLMKINVPDQKTYIKA